jgi:hypothetical protein
VEDSSFPEVDPSKDLVTIIPHHGSSLHAVVPRTSPLPSKDLVTSIPSLKTKHGRACGRPAALVYG